MTARQLGFVVVINALLSALISLVVVYLIVVPRLEAPGPLPASPRQGTPVVEGGGPVASSGITPGAEQADVTVSPAEPVIHVVQLGDSISALSVKYGVSVEDIIAANGLENPDLLRANMRLVIPVGGIPPTTPTLEPVPTSTETPLPFEPPSAETATAAAARKVTITVPPVLVPEGASVIAITKVAGPGDLGQERIVFTNVSTYTVDMMGWSLSDAEGNTYTFPNVRLFPEGDVTVYSRAGQDGSPPSSLFWGRTESVWTIGELIAVRDAEGQVVATGTVVP
jgi:LysM repeat protein